MRNIKIWIGVCFLFFAAGIAGILWNGQGTPGGMVQIIQDGNVLYTVNPSDREERTIEQSGRRNVLAGRNVGAEALDL